MAENKKGLRVKRSKNEKKEKRDIKSQLEKIYFV